MSTYVETLEKLQNEGLELLKQTQAVQIGALQSVREFVASSVRSTPSVPKFDDLPTFSELVDVNVKFANKVLELQKNFWVQLADVFTSAQKDAVAFADRSIKETAWAGTRDGTREKSEAAAGTRERSAAASAGTREKS